jgi:hypothetical protein
MAKSNTEKGISKMDAVRRALNDLGKHAMPRELHPYIKQNLGVDMSVDHISTYKSQILRKKSKGKGKKAAAHTDAAKASANREAAKAAPKAAASSLSQQVAMLKAASAALGKEEAKRIIDLF